MKTTFMHWTAIAALGFLCGSTAWADDVDGRITSIDADAQTFVVEGVTFHVTDRTKYEDGLNDFSGLQQDQRVEVDYEIRDGIHYATEIEPD